MNASSYLSTMLSFSQQNPRDVKKSISLAIENATMDIETAQQCVYGSKKEDQIFLSPSINLAKIMANTYGNFYIETAIEDQTQSTITAVVHAIDLQTNASVSMKSTLSILDSKGMKLNESGINATGAAAISIAMRTAIFAIIPKGVVSQVMNHIYGFLETNSETIFADLCTQYKTRHGIDQTQIFKLLEVKDKKQLTFQHILKFIGIDNSVAQGELKIEQLFDRKVNRKSPLKNSMHAQQDIKITYEEEK